MAQLLVDTIVAPDAVQVHDVLEIPAYQHVGFSQGCQRNVLAIGAAGRAYYFGRNILVGQVSRVLRQSYALNLYGGQGS